MVVDYFVMRTSLVGYVFETVLRTQRRQFQSSYQEKTQKLVTKQKFFSSRAKISNSENNFFRDLPLRLDVTAMDACCICGGGFAPVIETLTIEDRNKIRE